MTKKQRTISAYERRWRDLVDDGYLIRAMHSSSSLLMVTLKHRTNGRVISVTAYPNIGYLVQKTNSVVTHEERFTDDTLC